MKAEKYTRYERARIVGARALQIFMGAPVYIKTESIDPLEVALEEMRLGVIPITVKRDRRTSR
ncbi:MAG: DNA-directed RNA polymerase subunit K [Methanosaeta sp. PtaB.Bin039]|nr:MAG: DNA-directed RNA polymerase subunit K [Methanosaeta sp. PtaB.Bin039]OPY45602.1 MAG: DNA-directed RNA polymerase subunit K [Methanosaeta sp. PtaU1.Bin028]HOT07257.1 DNA-directed RNA polymerase subunit K [Methanotrichaceae archaeon]HQF17285.1 DNA-directed RNA polymerase subunit K [Methanotrichaceae archaeon]HQI91858.1 DNA-directed RNA polymerase subunit K [Methanotrichaceae archaeon]